MDVISTPYVRSTMCSSILYTNRIAPFMYIPINHYRFSSFSHGCTRSSKLYQYQKYNCYTALVKRTILHHFHQRQRHHPIEDRNHPRYHVLNLRTESQRTHKKYLDCLSCFSHSDHLIRRALTYTDQ